MSCIPLPTMAMVITKDDDPSTTPLSLPTQSTTNNTTTDRGHNPKDGANLTMVTQVHVTTSPMTEMTNDTSLPQWLAPFISILFSLVIVVTITTLVLIAIYRLKKSKKSKSLTKREQKPATIRDTKVIQVTNDGGESHAQCTTARLGDGLLIRRQHNLAFKVSTDETYSHANDTASPEPDVVVMVPDPEITNETDCEEDRYTRMPYEHNESQQSQSHMTLSHDSHMTNSESPVYDSIDSQPLYESISSTVGYDSALTRSTGSNASKQTVRSPTAVMKSHSQNRNSRSSFQHSLTIGGVYSTRSTTSRHPSSHTHHPPVSHRGMSTSSLQQTSGGGQRTSGRTSRVSHRLSTTGGSTVSSTTTGTSTRDSVNSIMTLHE